MPLTSQRVELLSANIRELVPTQPSPKDISQRVIIVLTDLIGVTSLTSASKKIGANQNTVLIVVAENVSNPCKFRNIVFGKPASSWVR